jgi:predicted GNAT family acetyltransferase
MMFGPGRAEPTTFTDNAEAKRYELRVEGKLAGTLAYQRRPGALIFRHTEVGPAFRGQGIGSEIVKRALNDAERRDLRVVPQCEFVQRFIRLQPNPKEVAEYAGW